MLQTNWPTTVKDICCFVPQVQLHSLFPYVCICYMEALADMLINKLQNLRQMFQEDEDLFSVLK